jgi:23S rRNA pseudouridine1911/1915/1917 synthase
VSTLFGHGTAAARRLLEAGRVRVDGRRRRKKGDRVAAGAVLEVDGGGGWLAPPPAGGAPLPVLYLDDDVVVVDKPRGMKCHPLVPGEGGTVVDVLAAAFPDIAAASPAAPREAGLCHRLDTDTTGCLAVARTAAAWQRLRAAFGDLLSVQKRYLALVEGAVSEGRTLAGALSHDPTDPRKMRVGDLDDDGAATVVAPHGQGGGATLVTVTLVGGRRHQVRAHLAAAGHPVVGDVLYGAAPGPRALLHAWRLRLPARAGVVTVESPAPDDLVAACAARGLAAALHVLYAARASPPE